MKFFSKIASINACRLRGKQSISFTPVGEAFRLPPLTLNQGAISPDSSFISTFDCFKIPFTL